VLRHLALTAVLLAAPLPLLAQDAASQKGLIVADVAAPWLHAGSGITVPPQIVGFTRGTIQQNGEQQLDVVVGYNATDTGTTLTLYIFRAWQPKAPVWFNQIDAAMHSPDSAQRLGGTLDAGPTITAFAPPGQKGATALRSAYSVTGNRVRSTGSAVIPAGDWLVTIRMSSLTLDKASLDAALVQTVAALSIPSPRREVEPAVPIAACASAMPLKPAKRAKADMTDSLFGGIMAQLATSEDDKSEAAKSDGEKPMEEAKPVIWCRDASSTSVYGVYRDTAGDVAGYIMAIGDAGLGADVAPSLAALISKKKRIAVNLHMLDRDFSFAPFTDVPTPEQVFGVIQRDQPISSSDRSSGNIAITVSP
jgi:hypothetical protein